MNNTHQKKEKSAAKEQKDLYQTLYDKFKI